MSEAPSGGVDAQGGWKGFAELAGGAAFIGLIAQLLAYLVARGFYKEYGLSPDQLGMTPLNAMLRMTSTGFITYALLMFVFLAGFRIHSSFYWRRRMKFSPSGDPDGPHWYERSRPPWRRKKLYRVTPYWESTDIVKRIRPLLTAGFAVFISTLGTLGSYAGGIAAQDRMAGDYAASANPIKQDLYPVAAILRWVKTEERPTTFFAGQKLDGRAVDYLGTHNGMLYCWDVSARVMVGVPVGQVQIMTRTDGLPDGQSILIGP